jgi:hypothetical protein
MTGASIVLFLFLAAASVYLINTRNQPARPRRHPSSALRPQRRIRYSNPARRQKAYYQARIRRMQRKHALVMLALLMLLKEQEPTNV